MVQHFIVTRTILLLCEMFKPIVNNFFEMYNTKKIEEQFSNTVVHQTANNLKNYE